MHYNGAGLAIRDTNWQADAANSIPISAPEMDLEFDGVATCLSTCLTKDGQQTPTANLPMGGFKLTGMANGSAATDSATYGQLQGVNLNSASLRNLFRNSSFAVAQHGTSFASPATASMTLDGWRINYSGTSGTFTLSQVQTTAVLGTGINNNALRLNQTVAGTSANVWIEQRIPGLRAFSSRTLIGNYFQSINSLVGGFIGKVEIGGNYGTGGSPTAAETYATKTFGAVYGTTYVTTRDWTLAVPDLSATKTFGTAGDDYLYIRIYFPQNTSTYDTFIQNPVAFVLPLGVTVVTDPASSVVPTMPYRSFDEEMNLCRRFYYRLGEVVNSFITQAYGAAGQNFDFTLVHPIQMWKAPTATKNGTWAVTNCGQPSVPVTTTRTAIVRAVVTALGTFSYLTDTTDDYLEFDAEP